ncbi:MAG TPA: methyl-accepting chemotaxis protein [Acidobacteriaceae bacterium]|nr:methyl-accepting chemotaxis protein [Acidobacteriaceae bacterium]
MSFSIGKKLLLAGGAMLLLSFTLGSTALVCIANIGNHLHEIVRDTARQQKLVYEMERNISFTMGGTKGILLRGVQGDIPGIGRNQDDFHAYSGSLEGDIDALDRMTLAPETRTALNQLKDAAAASRRTNDAILEAARAGNMASAFDIYNNTMKPVETAEKITIVALLQIEEADVARQSDAADAAVRQSRWITGLLLGLALLLGAVFVWIVQQVVHIVRSSVVELGDAADQIVSAADQISSASRTLAEGASEQAASIAETSSSVNEISTLAQRTQENSQAAAQMVAGSSAGFDTTNHLLQEMVEAMDGINNSSNKISKIIRIIDEIAFQTNILSLNAAVEAARAGSAGLGFAVVAEEVRSLAQRCADAAKSTAALIADSVERSTSGKRKVDQVADAIRSITEQSGQIATLVDQITGHSAEESDRIRRIGKTMHEIEHVTQSSAAGAQQGAAAADHLHVQSASLTDVVNRMRSLVDGRSRAAA